MHVARHPSLGSWVWGFRVWGETRFGGLNNDACNWRARPVGSVSLASRLRKQEKTCTHTDQKQSLAQLYRYNSIETVNTKTQADWVSDAPKLISRDAAEWNRELQL